MRRPLLIGMLFGSLTWLTPSLPAQDAGGAAAHQEAEENFKILNARLDDLAAANEALQKTISKLKEDVTRLADEVGRAGDRKESATAESLKQLKSAIEEVDSKRLADQKLVMSEFENLREHIKKILDKPLPKAAVPSPGPGPAPKNGNTHSAPPKPDRTEAAPPPGRENMFKYQIQDGDTLSLIVTELRKKGMKITQKQVMDANPGVNWRGLKINQTIFIPAAPPKGE